MFPEQTRRNLEAAQAALEAEAEKHEEEKELIRKEVARANEHARLANFKRDELQMALTAAEATIVSLTRSVPLVITRSIHDSFPSLCSTSDLNVSHVTQGIGRRHGQGERSL